MHAACVALLGWLSFGCNAEAAKETTEVPATGATSVATAASTTAAQPPPAASLPTGTGSSSTPAVPPTSPATSGGVVPSGPVSPTGPVSPPSPVPPPSGSQPGQEPSSEPPGSDVDTSVGSGESAADSHGSSAPSAGTTSESNVETASDDPNRPLTIWIAGDSTVANGNTPCPTGWGKHLGELFNEHVTIRNSAAGGRSVRTWMYNVQTEMGPDGECLLEQSASGEPTVQARWQEMLDDMAEGDALLIQFGINDGSPTCDRHVGLDAFKETYGVMIAAAKERGVQPVLITPTSAISCSGSNPQGTRGGYVDATIEAGQAADVPVLDLHARTVARYAELGFCPVAGGDVSASTGGAVGDYFCDDHTHFSTSGALDIASLVVELLVDAGVAFTSHVK